MSSKSTGSQQCYLSKHTLTKSNFYCITRAVYAAVKVNLSISLITPTAAKLGTHSNCDWHANRRTPQDAFVTTAGHPIYQYEHVVKKTFIEVFWYLFEYI